MTVRERILLNRVGVSLHCGDAVEVLRGLPAESVQCCVTSPSYYNLRDYGTARWEGGDPECSHQNPTQHQKQGANSQRAGRTNVDEQKNENYRDLCPLCGARRVDGQIGHEPTPTAYISRLVGVFGEVRRVLKSDGTLWVNIGDSYAAGKAKEGYSGTGNDLGFSNRQSTTPSPGLKAKDLIGIPWMLAFALRGDGWWLRQDIIFAKPNPMPESVQDRCTRSHEYVFLLTKSERYYWDATAISEPIATNPRENYPARAKVTGRGGQGAAAARGNDRDRSGGFPPTAGDRRNKRDVWWIPTKPTPWSKGLHFAAYPEALVEPMILAGSKPGDVVLDPFCGSGTTPAMAVRLGRGAVAIDLKPEYVDVSACRTLAEASK